MILKPDKGQGVVLIKKNDYKQSMERLFSDQRTLLIMRLVNTCLLYSIH